MRRLAALVMVLLGCEPPPVFPGADKRQNVRTARIEGTVVVSSVARGDVVLFLFDAARPPPPTGTGRPLTFTVVPRAALFEGAAAGNAGPFTAPYTFSLVAPGRYLVRAFVDANADFVPWYGVTAEVNAGDVGGAAVDPITRLPRVVEVTVDADQRPVAVLDVPVSISDAARVPVDRPAFSAATSPLVLGATPLEVDLRVLPINQGPILQGAPVFLVRLVDDDGDGVADDANGDGVEDLWPRVVVRKLAAEGLLTDENDADRNGILDSDPGFADYEHVDTMTGATVPRNGAPDLVVLQAGFDVRDLPLKDGQGRVKQAPTPATSLRLVILPRALDVSNLAAVKVLKTVPKGRYAITVIQSTGQTWRVPNELAPGLGEPRGLPELVSQSLVVEVP